ncbi:hypothetical protein C5F50_05060 [Nitrosopumilus ureiphilus]|uniref:Fibronectin type III domain-containing protein n=2 Tax=Nitrosopumilus ureiphilus TaxID=1470067 RepID=A0A7D5RHE5_9ARCH|nr:hypothetical protein C5F50_05060 [Nitrosopumilus ureiphilus]
MLFTLVVILNFDDVHAQPLQEVNADVIEFDGTFATVKISWNDNGASYYKVGCVSCMPNLSDTTTENLMVLANVASFADGNALLYVIAYDDADEIISAKQVMVKLK